MSEGGEDPYRIGSGYFISHPSRRKRAGCSCGQVVKKGGAPTAPLAARLASIDRDGPDLRRANRAAAFCGRGAGTLSPCNRVSGPCDDQPSKSNRASLCTPAITEGRERTNQPTGCELSPGYECLALCCNRAELDCAPRHPLDAVNDHFTARGIASQNQRLLRHLDSTWALHHAGRRLRHSGVTVHRKFARHSSTFRLSGRKQSEAAAKLCALYLSPRHTQRGSVSCGIPNANFPSHASAS